MKPLLQTWPVLFCATAAAADLPADPVQRDETIVITGQRIKQNLSDIPASISVITEEDLDRQVASELTHVFKNEPGVSVTGSAGRPQNITIRGIGGNRVLLVKDGVRVSDGFGADNLNDKVGRFTFDLDDIKQIEVAKGAGSSLHGADAIGGTVVITTKQPEEYLQGQDAYLSGKTLYSGDSDKSKTSLTGAARLMGSEHLLRLAGWQGHESANYFHSREPADLDGLSLSTSSRLPLAAHHALRLEFDYLEDNGARSKGEPTLAQPDGRWDVLALREQNTQRTSGGKLSWEARDLGPLESLTLSLHGTRSRSEANQRRLLRNDTLSGYPRYRSLQSLALFEEERLGGELALQSQHGWGAQQHRLSYGLELEQATHQRPVRDLAIENGITSYGSKAPFSRARTERAGLWLSDVMTKGAWQLTPTLRLDAQRLTSVGSHLDGNQSSHLSPSLALGYRLDETWRTWLSYANGYRAPAYDQVYGTIPHYFALPPFEIVPNPNLKAETSHGIEWGLSGAADDWSIKPSLFYNRYYNFIDWRQVAFRLDDGVFLRQYRNVANVEAWGAELAGQRWLGESWLLSTKLAWIDGKDQRDQPLRTLTPLEGSTSLRWQQAQLGAELTAYYAAPMHRVPQCEDGRSASRGDCQQTPGWVSVDVGLDWQVTDELKVNAILGNLLDARYVRYQDVAGLAAGSNTDLYTQSGRYLSANLSYRFVGL